MKNSNSKTYVVGKNNLMQNNVIVKEPIKNPPPPPKPPNVLEPVILKENFSLSREKEMRKIGR